MPAFGGLARQTAIQNTKGTASFLIAASDALPSTKRVADYICDGTADEVQINAAIQRLTGAGDITGGRTGGTIILSEGRFNIVAPILIDRGLRMLGQGAERTEIYLVTGSNCNMIEFKVGYDNVPRALNYLSSFELNGNKANNPTGGFGIWQDDIDNVAGIDIRMIDIWFESIKKGGISLARYWNHHIEWCTFEHMSGDGGTAIELRPGSATFGNLHIHHNFTTSIDHFLTIAGEKSTEDFATTDVDIATDQITITNNIGTGRRIRFSTTNGLPAPLAADTTYYVINIDATHIQVATTMSNAQAGTQINLTTVGTGTHTAHHYWTGRVHGVNITANIVNCKRTVFEIPGHKFNCVNNVGATHFDASNTYPIWHCNTDIFGGGVGIRAEKCNIAQNVIEPSGNGPKYYFHVEGLRELRGCKFDGNIIQTTDYAAGARTRGIFFEQTDTCTEVTICNNILSPGTGSQGTVDIQRVAKLNVTGNNFAYVASGKAFVMAATQTYLTLADNHLSGGVSGTFATGAGAPIVRNNHFFVTENSGTDTVANGTTSKAVTHGLDVTPAAGDIIIVPTESLGAAAEFYVDTYTSTQFTIHVDADPGKDLTFAWSARKKF